MAEIDEEAYRALGWTVVEGESADEWIACSQSAAALED